MADTVSCPRPNCPGEITIEVNYYPEPEPDVSRPCHTCGFSTEHLKALDDAAWLEILREVQAQELARIQAEEERSWD